MNGTDLPGSLYTTPISSVFVSEIGTKTLRSVAAHMMLMRTTGMLSCRRFSRKRMALSSPFIR